MWKRGFVLGKLLHETGNRSVTTMSVSTLTNILGSDSTTTESDFLPLGSRYAFHRTSGKMISPRKMKTIEKINMEHSFSGRNHFHFGENALHKYSHELELDLQYIQRNYGSPVMSLVHMCF